MSSELGFFCQWKLSNFSFAPVGKEIFSSMFPVDMLNYTKWSLSVKKKYDFSNLFILCYLNRESDTDSSPSVVDVFYKIYIAIDGVSLEEKYNSIRPWAFSRNSSTCGIELMSDEYYRKYFVGSSKEDTLTICCRMWTSETDDNLQYFIHTPIKVHKRCFKTTIEDFSILKQVKYPLKYSELDSSPFELIVRRDHESYSDESLCIKVSEIGKVRSQSVECKVLMLDAEGKIVISIEDKYYFEGRFAETWHLPPLIMQKKLFENKDIYFPDDTLSLLVEMKIQDGGFEGLDQINFTDISDVHTSFSAETEESTNALTTGLLKLYKDGKFCDVVIKTNNSSFYVHKVIICAQSAVFVSMLEVDIKEKETGTVLIPNMSDDTVEKMIVFLYTSKVQGLEWESALNLYFASDEYDIVQLKRVCSEFLKGNFSVSNVTEALILSDLHNDQELKATLDFVFKHDIEVFNSENWKLLLKNHAELAADTVAVMYRRLKLKK